MADQDVKQLLLQVDASIELLRSNLSKADAAVKSSTDGWSKDANRADASFANVGKGLNGLGPRLRELSNLTKQYSATNAAAAAKAQTMQREMQAQSEQIASGLRRSAGLVGAYFSAREISEINDKFTEFTNGLRVAGVEGSQTKVVQDALFASAQKYGVELNSLGTLYGRASQAATTLGASQSDLLRFSNGVSAALKVQGGSTESASGALLQLSQLLQAGTVRAEEFNSVNEGAFPILQAVAAGSDRFGGSVAKLRAEVMEGTVSSKEFFQAFLAGSDMLEQRAAKASLTAAAGFITIRNAMEVYVGEASNVSGASAAVGAALEAIANNIDVAIPAIAALGVALGVGFVANAARASIAARGAGGAILGAFGGPTGIAISATVIAIASLASEAAETEAAGRRASAAYEEMRQKLDATSTAASAAANGAAGVGKDAATATPKVLSFAGAVGELANKLYQQAAAAKEARVQMLKSQLVDRQKDEQKLAAALPGGRAAQQQEAGNAYWRGDFLTAGRLTWQNLGNAARNTLSGGRADRDNAENYRSAVKASWMLQQQIAREERTPVTASDLPGGGVATAPTGSSKALEKHQAVLADLEKLKVSASGAALKTINARIEKEKKIIGYLEQGVGSEAATAAASGGRARSAASTAKQEEAARQKALRDEMAYQSDLARGRLEELSLQAEATNNQALRADIERKRIQIDRDAQSTSIAAEGPAKSGGSGRYTDAQVAELQSLNSRIADARLIAVDTAERRRVAAETLEAEQADREGKIEILRGSRDLAETSRDRRELELRILDLQMEEERARLEAVTLANGANENEVKIAALRLKRLDTLRAQEAEKIDRDHESPLQQYRRQIRAETSNWNDNIENVEVRALENLTSGLAQAGAEYVKLGGIAGDVINGIISDLIRLATQQAIVNAIGGLGGGIGSLIGGGSKASGAIINNVGSVKTSSWLNFGFASGGYTGNLPEDQVAGVVHGREYVFDAAATSRIGVEQLEAIRNGQFNLSSMASRAVADVRGNSNGGSGTAQVEVYLSEDLEARVHAISGDVAVSVVRASAPGTIQAAKAATMTELSRARI